MNNQPQIETRNSKYVKVNQGQRTNAVSDGFIALSQANDALPTERAFFSFRNCAGLVPPIAMAFALHSAPQIKPQISSFESNSLFSSNHRKTDLSTTTQASDTLESEDIAILSAADMLSSVREFFGLNMAQTARVFGISRATLYNHVNTDSAPVVVYQELHSLVEKLAVDSPDGLGSKIKSVLVENETLLDILYTKPLNLNRIEEVTKIITATNESDRPKIGLNKLRSTISGIHSAKTG